MNTEHTPLPFIRTLLVTKSEEDIKDAQERFFDFLELAERIHTRMLNEEEP